MSIKVTRAQQREKEPMKLRLTPEQRKKLGLSDTASEQEIQAAVSDLVEANAKARRAKTAAPAAAVPEKVDDAWFSGYELDDDARRAGAHRAFFDY